MGSGLDERTKHIIIGVISTLIPQAKIYLFGSRARGDFNSRSDIDVALDAGLPLERVEVGQVRDMLNESNILQKIEIVDLQSVPEVMKNNILREGIVWKD